MSHTLNFRIVYRGCDQALEDRMLHGGANKDLAFLKAVIKISGSQRGMTESEEKENELCYLQNNLNFSKTSRPFRVD